MYFASFTGPDLSQFRLMVPASVLKDVAAETLLLSGLGYVQMPYYSKRKLLLLWLFHTTMVTNQVWLLKPDGRKYTHSILGLNPKTFFLNGVQNRADIDFSFK